MLKKGDIVTTFLPEDCIKLNAFPGNIIPIKCKIIGITKDFRGDTQYQLESIEDIYWSPKKSELFILESDLFACFDNDGLIDKHYQAALEQIKKEKKL